MSERVLLSLQKVYTNQEGSSFTENYSANADANNVSVFYFNESKEPISNESNTALQDIRFVQLVYKTRANEKDIELESNLVGIVINEISPSISQQPASQTIALDSTKEETTATLSIESACADSNAKVTRQWYIYDDETVNEPKAIEGATNASYSFITKETTNKYFYCIVTSTNNSVNGTKYVSVKSAVATLNIVPADATLSSITATFGGNYVLSGATPSISSFTITKAYNTDPVTSVTEKLTSGNNTDYNIDGVISDAVGTIKLSVTYTKDGANVPDDKVLVPYKYKSIAPVATKTLANSEYNTLEAPNPESLDFTCSDFTTYALYDANGERQPLNITDAVLYQWYSCTNSEKANAAKIENATNATYTPNITTVGTFYYYCVASTKSNGDSTTCVNPTEVLATESNVACINVVKKVNSFASLKNAIQNGEDETIVIEGDIEITETIAISTAKKIIANSDYTLTRGANFTETLFNLANSESSLTLNEGSENILTIDGNNVESTSSLITVINGNLVANKVVFTNAKSEADGAAIYFGTATDASTSGNFTACTFTNNKGTGNSTNSGGGAIGATNVSNLNFSDCSFTLNNANLGGAIYMMNNTVSNFNDCVFNSNEASDGGTDIFINKAKVTLSGNTSLSSGGNTNAPSESVGNVKIQNGDSDPNNLLLLDSTSVGYIAFDTNAKGNMLYNSINAHPASILESAKDIGVLIPKTADKESVVIGNITLPEHYTWESTEDPNDPENPDNIIDFEGYKCIMYMPLMN